MTMIELLGWIILIFGIEAGPHLPTDINIDNIDTVMIHLLYIIQSRFTPCMTLK